MIDLKHWDTFQTFTCKQAACLIAGIEPSHQTVQLWGQSRTELWSMVLMEEHYQNALSCSQTGGFDPNKYGDLLLPSDLQSIGLERLRLRVNGPKYELNFWKWANTEGDIDKQKFSRFELSRWIEAKKILSKYQFKFATHEAVGNIGEPSVSQTISQNLNSIFSIEKSKKNGTKKRWTEDELARLKEFRASHTEKQTAAHFGVSGSLVRRLLSNSKAPINKRKKITPFDGLGKR